MRALGYHGTAVWRMLFFTLSNKRKARGFQSPTCIATITVPFWCRTPNTALPKQEFRTSRVVNHVAGKSVLSLMVASACQRQNKHARDFCRTTFSRYLSIFLQWSVSYGSSHQSVHRYAREQRYSFIARATLCTRRQNACDAQAFTDMRCTKHASALCELQGDLGALTFQVHRARRILDVLHRSL